MIRELIASTISAIALSEIFLEYRQTRQFTTVNGPLGIRSFLARKEDIAFLKICIGDIIQQKPDEDGEREYTDLHKESPGWPAHIRDVFEKLNVECVKLEV